MQTPPFLEDMKRVFFLGHAPLSFHFVQRPRDFVVDELPLYPFSGEGEHLILKVRKKELTTEEMIKRISSHIGIKARDIGYAGLKDRNSLATQYISIHKSHEAKVDALDIENIKIVEKHYHKNKLKMGHLAGNRFFIRIKKLNAVDAKKIEEGVARIAAAGMPNRYGYQRFGDGSSLARASAMVLEGARVRSAYERRFLTSVYQSALFNRWLDRRIGLSRLIAELSAPELKKVLGEDVAVDALQHQKTFFKLLQGDVMQHYPAGRLFHVDALTEESTRFVERTTAPTGPIFGKKMVDAKSDALLLESDLKAEAEMVKADGTRRFAWIFPEDIEFSYKESEMQGEFHLSLPKGAYATNFLEEIKAAEL